MNKRNFRWYIFDSEGYKRNGNYEGQVKGSVPHGLGKLKGDDGKWIIEG